MKVPINCPVCGDPFVNHDNNTPEYRGKISNKTCSRRLNHVLELSYDHNTDEVLSAHLTYDRTNMNYVVWFFDVHHVWVSKRVWIPKGNGFYEGEAKNLQLPWFEPDFSNLKKLVQKIKTYVLFS